MFYYINLLRRALRKESKPFTAKGSEPKTFITDLNFTKSKPQFGGMDATPQIMPTLEHFTDMSALGADSDPEHINNDSNPEASGDDGEMDGEMNSEMDGESEAKADNLTTDIAEVTLAKTLSQEDLEEFIDVFQSQVLYGAELEPGIERSPYSNANANFAYFDVVRIMKSKARMREGQPASKTESSEADAAASEDRDEDSE